MEIGGVIYEGVNNIKLAQMGDPNTLSYIVRNFTTGRLLIHFAILPGAALAMYKTARPENKKKAASILIPAILTAMLVGVTEPIEYTFLFVAPLLYFLAYVPLAGLTYVVTEATNVSIMGESFRNMFPNLLQPQKVHAWSLLYLIPVFFIVAYILFKYVIVKFNIKTPGLGGADNIVNVTNCATRLRVELNDAEKTADNDTWVNKLEATGVVRRKKSLQVIYGPHVITLAAKVKEQLGMD